VRELAAATATLVTEHDMIGAVSDLLSGCVRSVGGAGGRILVAHPDDDRLEFLSATTATRRDIAQDQLQSPRPGDRHHRQRPAAEPADHRYRRCHRGRRRQEPHLVGLAPPPGAGR
jgi:hypothetical protein